MDLIGCQCVAQARFSKHMFAMTWYKVHTIDATNVNIMSKLEANTNSVGASVVAHHWSCSAGFQRSSMWSGSSRGQRFAGLSG